MSEAEQTSTSPVGEPLHPRPPTPTPEPPAKKKGSNELALRLLSSALLVPTVLYVIATGGLLYLVVVTLFILIGLREFYGLIEAKGAQPLVGLGLAAAAALPVVAYVGNEYHATLLMTASLLGLMVAQLRKAEIQESLASISGTFFGVFYVGWLLSHAIVLRGFYDTVLAKYPAEDLIYVGLSPQAGIFFMVYTLAVSVWCDAGAYFAGRAFGKRKLAPRVSPGKSVEGALGGVFAGTVVGLITKGIFDLFWPDISAFFPWSAAIPFGIVLCVVGILGDLIESLLKRDLGVKDSSSWMRGLGGILDILDSVLAAAPVAFVCWAAGLVGPA